MNIKKMETAIVYWGNIRVISCAVEVERATEARENDQVSRYGFWVLGFSGFKKFTGN